MTQKFRPYHRQRARRFVIQTLYGLEMTSGYYRDAINEMLANDAMRSQMSKIDVPFFTEAVETISKISEELDSSFTPYLTDRELHEVSPIELVILRLGAYELLHRLDVPYKVVINESLELAKMFGADEAHKFVNSVMDKLALDARKAEIGSVNRTASSDEVE